jgi:guanylate kinase
MRKGESQGVPYFFVTEDEFNAKKEDNFFVEWARVHNHLYGTSRVQIEDAWEQGRCVIMDVDIQGAKTFKTMYPQSQSIFILPPSIEELRKRIIKRDGKIPADIDVRMDNAKKEMKEASGFDYRIVNDHFETSYAEFKKIIENLLA